MTHRAERAVRTLSRVDPEFGSLCDLLYGSGVDAETIYADVFSKLAGPELDERRAATRKKRIQAAGAVIGGASSVLAANEVGQGVRTAARGIKLGRGTLKPLKAGEEIPTVRHGLRRVGAGVILGSGDVLGTLALNEGAHKKVTKASPLKIPNLATHVAGIRAAATNFTHTSGLGRLIESTAPEAKNLIEPGYVGAHRMAPDPAKVASAAERGKQAGEYTAEAGRLAFGTRKRKIGTAAVATAGYLKVRRNNEDPYPMAKSEMKLTGTFSKLDTDKRQVFGWASVVEKNGLPVVDRQGDFINAEEIEKAIYDYVQHSRVGGDMHRRTKALAVYKGDDSPHHAGDLIECVVFTKEKKRAMGIPDEAVPDGVWVGYQIHDEGLWQEVKKGNRTGFSIHGKGKRTSTTIDELMAA